jgi:hypothetical protein
LIALPIISAVIALACAIAVTLDLVRKPRPDRIAWLVAFALFAIAAGAEAIGDAAHWTPLLVRLYYVTGAVLVVGFLALGQLLLLEPKRIGRIAPGVGLLMIALSVSTVWGASIDSTKLETDGWEALHRSTGLILLTVGINSLGTLILIGGLVYSAIRFRQLGTMRNRMLGCLLIAGGTLVVAAGGTLTRFGSQQYLYIAMSVGIALIFTGYLWTKVPDGHAFRTRPIRSVPETQLADGRSPGIAFLEGLLTSLDNAALAAECRIWSVAAKELDAFSRTEARRVWAFRNRLTLSGQSAFDARPPSLRLQLAELYFEVMTADLGALDRVQAPVGIGTHRDESLAASPVRTGSGSVD